MYWNPAGLAGLEKREISAMHTEWITDIRYDFLGYVHPVGRVGVLAGSFSYLSMGELERRGENREKLGGGFTAYDLAVALSYSKALSQVLNLGVNLKFIQQKIEKEDGYGIAFDLGAICKVWVKGLSLGLTLQNLGPKMKFIKEAYSLPLTLTMGVGYRFVPGLTLALDVRNQFIEKRTTLSFGTEYWPIKLLALRAGYVGRLLSSVVEKRDEKIGDLLGLGAGLGLRLFGYEVDYSFVPFGDLGETHRISFSARF
ncbi:MAG: PorV/PorQ family protein [bacterium]